MAGYSVSRGRACRSKPSHTIGQTRRELGGTDARSGGCGSAELTPPVVHRQGTRSWPGRNRTGDEDTCRNRLRSKRVATSLHSPAGLPAGCLKRSGWTRSESALPAPRTRRHRRSLATLQEGVVALRHEVGGSSRAPNPGETVAGGDVFNHRRLRPGTTPTAGPVTGAHSMGMSGLFDHDP